MTSTTAYQGNFRRLDMNRAVEMAAFIRANRPHLKAIGEVGLDFWAVQDDSGKALQQEVLKLFIALSRELDLPLNVHSRSGSSDRTSRMARPANTRFSSEVEPRAARRPA